MVIPLSSPGLQLIGAPPPEAADDLKRLKWSVVALVGFSLGRLVTAGTNAILDKDLTALMSIFINIIMGTFVLKDDPIFSRAYECLSTTICQQCAQRGMDGLGCLMPFLVCDAVNLVFDILFKSWAIRLQPYGLFLLGCMVAEGVSAYFAWTTFKICRDMSPGSGAGGSVEMESGDGGGGYVQAGAGGSARSMFSGGGAGAGGGSAAAGAPAGSFTVFSGAGNRLGG